MTTGESTSDATQTPTDAATDPAPHDPAPHDPARHDLAPHDPEPHAETDAGKLNWLRAAVLGANDGIVSMAGLVTGVAGSTATVGTVATVAIAGLVAGALSMAGGEYVSVSAQRDTEKSLLELEKWELEHLPAEELDELAGIYEGKGLTPELARQVAEQLTAHDALTAHAEAELGIDPTELTNPWHAAGASMAAFTVGGLLPVLAILWPPVSLRVPVCIVAVAVALALTGWISARWGRSGPARPIARNVAVGLVSMAITYSIGRMVG